MEVNVLLLLPLLVFINCNKITSENKFPESSENSIATWNGSSEIDNIFESSVRELSTNDPNAVFPMDIQQRNKRQLNDQNLNISVEELAYRKRLPNRRPNKKRKNIRCIKRPYKCIKGKMPIDYSTKPILNQKFPPSKYVTMFK